MCREKSAGARAREISPRRLSTKRTVCTMCYSWQVQPGADGAVDARDRGRNQEQIEERPRAAALQVCGAGRRWRAAGGGCTVRAAAMACCAAAAAAASPAAATADALLASFFRRHRAHTSLPARACPPCFPPRLPMPPTHSTFRASSALGAAAWAAAASGMRTQTATPRSRTGTTPSSASRLSSGPTCTSGAHVLRWIVPPCERRGGGAFARYSRPHMHSASDVRTQAARSVMCHRRRCRTRRSCILILKSNQRTVLRGVSCRVPGGPRRPGFIDRGGKR